MKLLLGTDIIEIDRIKNAIEKNNYFIKRVFTVEEVRYCESRKAAKFQSYAARFAAKEAVAKAFGTGIGEHAQFNEIEILNDKSGKPFVKLHGRACMYYMELSASDISISLSHCKDYAVAYVSISVEKN